VESLKRAIREIPDFPKQGILFYDVTTLFRDAECYGEAVDLLKERYRGRKLDGLLVVEARGFVLGSALAYALGVGLILARKKGKLPHTTLKATYALEYGTDQIEIHADAVSRGDRILVVDDLLATGGTAAAAASLVEEAGGVVEECCFLIELESLEGRKKLHPRSIFTVLQYP